ncbi:glycosyltransferase [Lachnospiraceae bacterium 54-53]
MHNVIVLMSTYNGEKYIKEQIDSIIRQEGCSVHIFARDDGSNDSTINILEMYSKQGSLTWYKGENLKSAGSFIDLFFSAPESEYYAFADQDDIWDRDKLRQAIGNLPLDRPAFYHSNARIVNSEGNDTGRLLHNKDPKINFYSLACAGGILGCTMVFNKALHDYIISKPKPKALRMHDYYIVMVCLGINGVGIYDEEAHIGYRQHGNNVLGIPVGLSAKFKNKISQFNTVLPYSIADQATEIIDHYGQQMPEKYYSQCKAVANYKKNFITTIRVAFSTSTHYSSIKNSAFIRMCLLLRRR